MWSIRDRKTKLFFKGLFRDDGLGIPDILMTDNPNDAKIYKSYADANDIVNRFKGITKLEVIRVWGRTPN